MYIATYIIGLPLAGGAICLLVPKFKEVISVAVSLMTLITAIAIFIISRSLNLSTHYFILDNLSKFVLLSVALFGFLIILFSLEFMKKLAAHTKVSLSQYYCYVLWTLGAALGVVLSNNLIVLLVFWGFLGLTLYLLIQIAGSPARNNPEKKDSAAAAKKSLIIIGGSDVFMLLGIVIVWSLSGTLQLDQIHIGFASKLPLAGFICLAVAAFAKAGVMPLHTWIPDMATEAPIPVTAYLPASLDKLLGIYLLMRVCIGIFSLYGTPTGHIISFLLMAIGAVTIIAAVFMAVIQHDLKKLLSYHAVSQVGYMILGIGTGNPVGIAGGLFHMINNAIYKSGLFLTSGSVEHQTGTTDLDRLGGLGKYMPLTFISCLVAALSISGIPPMNGFMSKWMIYQGVVQYGTGNSGFLSKFWWIFLVVALFGSALTLASFMKLIHGVFLGQKSEQLKPEMCKEVKWTMWLPTVILAFICVVFGIFAYQLPLKYFIFPSMSVMNLEPSTVFTGWWQPGLATLLIIVGIAIGFAIYVISTTRYRKTETFIGGEKLPNEVRVTGVDFYQTITEKKFFKTMFGLAEKKKFDIYDWGKKIVFWFGSVLSELHSGDLETYLSWCLAGAVILLLVLIR